MKSLAAAVGAAAAIAVVAGSAATRTHAARSAFPGQINGRIAVGNPPAPTWRYAR